MSSHKITMRITLTGPPIHYGEGGKAVVANERSHRDWPPDVCTVEWTGPNIRAITFPNGYFSIHSGGAFARPIPQGQLAYSFPVGGGDPTGDHVLQLVTGAARAAINIPQLAQDLALRVAGNALSPSAERESVAGGGYIKTANLQFDAWTDARIPFPRTGAMNRPEIWSGLGVSTLLLSDAQFATLDAATKDAPVIVEMDFPVYLFQSVPENQAPAVPTGLKLGYADPNIIATWTASDTTDKPPAKSYDLRHRHNGRAQWFTIPGFTTTFGSIPGVFGDHTYEVQVRAVGLDGKVSAWSPSVNLKTPKPPDITNPAVVPTPPSPPIRTTITPPGTVDPIVSDPIEGGDVLAFNCTMGRSTGSFLEQVKSMSGQVIVDNRSGKYDDVLPNSKFHLSEWVDGIPEDVVRGWTGEPEFTTDPTGRKIATIPIEGALQQLSYEHWDFAVNPLWDSGSEEEDRMYRYTGLLAETILDDAGWPASERNIDRGYFRVYAPSLGNVLGQGQLRTPIGPLRAIEKTEWSLMHELRGDKVYMENRFKRELDTRDPLYTFSDIDDSVRVIRITPHRRNYKSIYNDIALDVQGSLVLNYQDADNKDILVMELARPVQVAANDSIDINLNLNNCRFTGTAEDREIRHTTSITNPRALTNADIDLSADVPVTHRFTRIGVIVTVNNNTNAAITVNNIKMVARAVVNYDTLAFVNSIDEESIKLYRRKSLSIKSLVDVGIEAGSEQPQTRRALQQTADYIKWKVAYPIDSGTVTIDLRRYRLIMSRIQMSDPVTISEVIGLPSGVYHVEGISINLRPEIDTMTLAVSRRGARTVVADASDISAVNPPDNRPLVVGVQASRVLNTQPGEVIFRIDGAVVDSIAFLDDDPEWYVFFIPAGTTGEVSATVANASVSAWRVVALDR